MARRVILLVDDDKREIKMFTTPENGQAIKVDNLSAIGCHVIPRYMLQYHKQFTSEIEIQVSKGTKSIYSSI